VAGLSFASTPGFSGAAVSLVAAHRYNTGFVE
jgi:hypothetical protein